MGKAPGTRLHLQAALIPAKCDTVWYNVMWFETLKKVVHIFLLFSNDNVNMFIPYFWLTNSIENVAMLVNFGFYHPHVSNHSSIEATPALDFVSYLGESKIWFKGCEWPTTCSGASCLDIPTWLEPQMAKIALLSYCSEPRRKCCLCRAKTHIGDALQAAGGSLLCSLAPSLRAQLCQLCQWGHLNKYRCSIPVPSCFQFKTWSNICSNYEYIRYTWHPPNTNESNSTVRNRNKHVSGPDWDHLSIYMCGKVAKKHQLLRVCEWYLSLFPNCPGKNQFLGDSSWGWLQYICKFGYILR